MKSIDAACCRAWGRMYRQRHCPDLSILMEGSRQAQRHLASCGMCRARLDSAAEAAELGALLMKIPVRMPPATPPRPGDVRALRPRSSGLPRLPWLDRDRRFCNAPLLLVLGFPDAQGFVQVAQVFDESALCVTGEDIALGTGLFAEAWNTYAVPAQALDPVAYARAWAQVADRVRQWAREPFAAVEEHSPVHAFRQDECRTGSLFSMQLTLHALKELERETEEGPEEESEEETAARFLARLSRRSCPAQPDSLPDTTSGIESGTGPWSEPEICPEICPETGPVTASEARWQEGILCEGTGADWPMDYAASGSPGSLGRGPRSRVTAHRVLICPPGGMPRWIPADVRCRECAGKTLFGITCQPGTDPWPVSVSAFYQGRSALTIQAGWLRDRILQIDASFAGSIRDLAWLHIAVEAGSDESFVDGSTVEDGAADRRPENAGGDGQAGNDTNAGQAANGDDKSGCSLN